MSGCRLGVLTVGFLTADIKQARCLLHRLTQMVNCFGSSFVFFCFAHRHIFSSFMKLSKILLSQQVLQISSRSCTALMTMGLVLSNLNLQPAFAASTAYCQQTVEEVNETDSLRKAAFGGDNAAMQRYKSLVVQKARNLQECRRRTWPQVQAIWLRLYPCDIQDGVLEAVLDRIVARGYNQVYVEYFYDGQVLLPESQNRSAWPSAVRIQGAENVDLFAKAIEKGRERGLKVYAWFFTMNFGYNYGQRPDRQQTVARKGNGQTSVDINSAEGDDIKAAEGDVSKFFVDPYSPIARRDYAWIIAAALQRRPDGVLFDYVRYPRQTGPASVATKVKDLWIYGDAAKEALLQRALNQKGRELIRRYLDQGSISTADVDAINKMFPSETQPMWQGRKVESPRTVSSSTPPTANPPVSVAQLQAELWYLSVAHAVQGIVDFVSLAAQQVQRQGIPAGAVFFPGGNKPVGTGGFDSRLQPWDRFPASMEWHPMAYAKCGERNTSCILQEIQRVLSMSPAGTQVIPALAGTWGDGLKDRPALEVQMQAIQRAFPQIRGVSHFAYSWQEPEADRGRKFCEVR